MKGTSIRFAFVLGAVAFLASCYPTWPKVTPSVTGHIMQNGVPVGAAEVYVVQSLGNEVCHETKLKAVTSSDGSFNIGPSREFEWSIPGDRMARWSLCVKHENKWVVAHTESNMGFPRESAKLQCDLTTPTTERLDQSIGDRWIRGLCNGEK